MRSERARSQAPKAHSKKGAKQQQVRAWVGAGKEWCSREQVAGEARKSTARSRWQVSKSGSSAERGCECGGLWLSRQCFFFFHVALLFAKAKFSAMLNLARFCLNSKFLERVLA